LSRHHANAAVALQVHGLSLGGLAHVAVLAQAFAQVLITDQLKTQCSSAKASPANSVPPKGAAAATARLSMAPSMILATLSKAVLLPNVRGSESRSSARAAKKTRTARVSSCPAVRVCALACGPRRKLSSSVMALPG
jgi:hypothetical protein